jgi:citrate lyase subunit beta/citryl-CoA lyase
MVRDQVALEADCNTSRSLGHRGRVCIHPDQVPVVNRVFGPDPDEVVFARKVIDAFAKAERSGSASITVDGVFVDYPIVYKAERIVALAESIAGRQPMAKAP